MTREPGASGPLRAPRLVDRVETSDGQLWAGGTREGRPPAVRIDHVPLPPDGLRLGAWVAPAVFGAPPGGAVPVVDADDAGPGVGLHIGLRRHGVPYALVRAGDDVVELEGTARVAELGWTRLELVVEPGPGDVRFLVGDHVVASAPAPAVALAERSETTQVVVGGQEDGWYGWFVGVLGPVWLSDAGDTPPGQPTDAPADLWRVPADAYQEDRDRPSWHFLPPRHWMNEPHGVVHHAGRHHLFYQRSELGPFWGEISWGHALSDDLVHWIDVGHALAPWDVACAPDGVWSGSASTDGDGLPVVFFTAGDARDEPNQRTALARPADSGDPDLRHWLASDPVTTIHPAADALSASGRELLAGQFRDPFVWREGETWFQLVGAGIDGVGGTALLYRCPDPEPVHWEFVGPLTVGDAVTRPDTGVMWELPLLLPVGPGPDGRPRHALLVTPWWPEPNAHSLLHEWYWVGTWDAATATWHPEHDEPRELDHGGWLTGVTGSQHPDGRTLLWSITQDLLSEDEHRRRRWAGSAGSPLQVRYAHGDLQVAPVDEIAALRGDVVCDLQPHGAGTWSWSAGPSYEVRADLDLQPGARARIDLRDGAVTLLLHRLDRGSLEVTVLRPDADEPGRGRRSATVRADDDVVPLRLLADHSVIEVFIAGRPVTTRAWARPGSGETGRLDVTGGRLRHLRVQTLDAAPVEQDRKPT
jgi:sucrose-6-phosphate hydrolase SacC (GH32 family)